MSAARQKGTTYETLVLQAFRQHWPDAKRNPLAGSRDVGDIFLPGERRFTVECKNRAVMALPAWVKQARASAKNLDPDAVGVVVHKRKSNAQPGEQWVTMELDDFLSLVAP